MSHCISKTHPEYISLKEKSNLPEIVLNAKISIWQTNNTMDRFPTVEELSKPSEVNFVLKTTNIISKNIDKISKLFKQLKDTDTFWNKIQKDFQIPKDQLELLKNSEGNTIEEKLLDFVANYSYTVEINTAKENHTDEGIDSTEHNNLIVPGGTNYKINVFKTLLIIPSIINHFFHKNQIGWFRSDEVLPKAKEFEGKDVEDYKKQLEDDGITGWEQDMFVRAKFGTAKNSKFKTRRILEVQDDWLQKLKLNFRINDINYSKGTLSERDGKYYLQYYELNKKERRQDSNSRSLTKQEYDKFKEKSKNNTVWLKGEVNNEVAVSTNEYFKAYDEFIDKGDILAEGYTEQQRQFAKLLANEEYGWTFRIKAIIQDSAKKGYEKVLFPTGDTASKVEGHSTLEEFKRQKEDRIKQLETYINKYKKEYIVSENRYEYGESGDYENIIYQTNEQFDTKEEAQKVVDKYNDNNTPYIEFFVEKRSDIITPFIDEINQLKQELKRVETEGFGALRPIFNFYENTVTNILKKQGYNPTLITDEYGNTWNEISINLTKDLSYIQFQKLTQEEKAKTIEQVTKEHRSITALKDLAHKLAHRIGGKVKFENNPNADWKGYNQGMTSVLNEAYMTPDTPFHEVLAHPIIRALKYSKKIGGTINLDGTLDKSTAKAEFSKIYQNLLKELETGRGKEVFEQVKGDYKFKESAKELHGKGELKIRKRDSDNKWLLSDSRNNAFKVYDTEKEAEKGKIEYENIHKYTLEEQQEEAIVTLLGMLAADKLDAKKDATLISKLKELWKQVSDFVKSLLRQDGIKIDELPITTTLNDLAEILAYGDNKIILPGYKVEYSTPLGNKYDTLEEVNQEIRGLADANTEVDLSDVKINNELPKSFYLNENDEHNATEHYFEKDGQWYLETQGSTFLHKEKITKEKAEKDYRKYAKYQTNINSFIEKNKEYEQVKDIIEEWKKENNIQYDPEEVYSRGQGFYSSIGAYSNLELDLLLKNLIQHIQDNKKAGGEFTISAFTKPIDKRLKHIEGTGDRVRFVIYPKSEHIKWAAPTDVYSGSVWDAHEKVSKDKKSELLGVSFTKAPALRNINEVSPNLADIIDNLSHVHNELGIELTTANFRIEYDDNIDYSTKKLIDNINKILDDKYGKLVKPKIKKAEGKTSTLKEVYENIKNDNYEYSYQDDKYFNKLIYEFNLDTNQDYFELKSELLGRIEEILKQNPNIILESAAKQPSQTRENTTSIESIKDRLGINTPNNFRHEDFSIGDVVTIEGIKGEYKIYEFEDSDGEIGVGTTEIFYNVEPVDESTIFDPETNPEGTGRPYFRVPTSKMKKVSSLKEKEYTSQALINLKVAALKEVARKYPRSLITSKVVPINPNMSNNSEIQYSKKQGYNPVLITDEYGNTWNEIELSDDNLTTILASTQEPTKLGQFKKYIKLPKLGKQVSSLNRTLIQERIETFNKENNTSFYVNFEQVGEVANDNFKIISIVNKAKSSEPTLFDEQDEEYLPENQNTESQEVNEPISTTDLTEQQQTTHKNSQLNQYFGNKKVKKASELLPLLYGRTKEGFFYNLIQQVLKVFHNDVNVKVLTEEEFIKYKEENKLKFNESTDGLRINGGYVSKLNEIFVVDYADSNMDTIILHEVLHSLSYHYLRENTSLNEEFQDLYNKAKSLLSKEEKAKYAISDIDEFFAHLSDPNFIKLLASKKSVNTEGLTIWAKLKQILTEVLKSLGIEVNGTFLEDYFNLATRILQEAKNTDDFYKRYDEEYGDNPVNANATSLDKEINVQDSNFKALEKNNKTVSIREVGKHDYKRGDILTVKVNNKATDTKVRVTSVTTIQDFTKLSKQEKDEFAKSIGNYIDFEDFQNSDDYANATSPQSLKYPHVYKFITGKEPADIIRYTLVEKSIVDQESPYKKQQIFLSRKIKRLEQELKQINPASYSYEAKSNEIKALKEKLAKAIGSKNDHSIYLELGEELFKEIDELLTKFETSEPTTDKLTYVGQVLEAWKDFEDLEGKAKKLYRRYRLLVAEHTLKTANEHNTGGKKITREDLDKDTKDIRTFTMGTGALSDSVNIITRTIGSIIKAAQNIVATKNKLLAKDIQTEIDLLDDYAKKNGVTLDELYKEVFIQEHKNSTILTKPYFEDGTPNPNYDKIQDTPELKKFYEFYQKKIEEFEKGLPQSFGKYFIPNIAKTGIKDDIKNLNPFQKRKVGFSFNTENMADIIETKYEAFIPASRKESNLGEVLLKFGMYANNYEKMSSVLPEVRLLQEQLEYKINSKGEPIEREFINPSDPSKSVTGKKSKIWKQVDGVINMQVKGNMKDEGQGKYRVKTTKYDKEGNPKEEIYFNLTGLLDNLLKYNSLLRIGLSPITAISNVIFGDASNLIEAIGGQFFGVKDLTTASNIFIRQNLNKDSNLNRLLVELNPLQELDDYEYQEQIRLTGKTIKISKEKAQEYIYGMQKSGEKWLQSRTMLAVLIHDGYMNTNGDLLQKYEDLTEEQKTQLTDKIQRLNQQIHGRYTQKEAAIWQQSVVYRMISQFRKWIPAAIESRIGSKRYDSRLQTEVEGRYITIKNLVVNLQDTLERLKKGELTETETYNMRKSLAEIIMLLATVFLYAGLKGDDDDKKRRKNPYVKLALTLLNRTAGDLGYFYDPTQVATIGNKAIPLSKTVEDLIKVVEYLPYAVYPGDFKIMGKKFSDTHKSGSIKGYNKFYNQLGKQIPGIKPIKDLTRIASDFELEELR